MRSICKRRTREFRSRVSVRILEISLAVYGRGGTVGRGRGVGVVLGVGDAIGVGVAVAVAVADAAAVAVGVGLAPPPWKLNLPIRVCQMPLWAYWLIW